MRGDRLSRLFTGVAAKRLAAVEAERTRSNQHEFNGTAELKRLLGEHRLDRLPARFVYLAGDEDGIADDGFVTWYDARERHPRRSEWRLYFPANDVMDLAREGDLLVVARRSNDEPLIVVAPAGSDMEIALRHLFEIGGEIGQGFLFEDLSASERKIDFAARFILDELGIEGAESDDDRIGRLVDQITAETPSAFPGTRKISELARQHAEAPDARDDPDAALIAWLEFEEVLFRQLERVYLRSRLADRFMHRGEPDVDAFVSTALSVLNRRKSRMGLSLENHVEAVLKAWPLRFERGARTEGNSRPDFLFPGSAEYADHAFDPTLLALLAVKSTLKDRWRQVLAEAARIREKHLLTIQPGVSPNQVEEMQRNHLRLVVPAALHPCYGPHVAGWLMKFRDFLEFVRDQQRRIPSRL